MHTILLVLLIVVVAILLGAAVVAVVFAAHWWADLPSMPAPTRVTRRHRHAGDAGGLVWPGHNRIPGGGTVQHIGKQDYGQQIVPGSRPLPTVAADTPLPKPPRRR